MPTFLARVGLAALLTAPYETVITEQRTADAAADGVSVMMDDAPLALDGVVSTLQQVPGLQLTRLGGLGAPLWVSLRGSSTAQVAVFLDGVPMQGLAQSSVDLNDLPWGDIARTDVYRGTSPLVFGTGALGGVLALTTRLPQAAEARAGLAYGSFDTFGADLQAAAPATDAMWHAGVHAISTRGDFVYRSDGGTAFTPGGDRDVLRANNALHQGSALLGGRWRRGAHRLRFWVWGLSRQQGVPNLGIRQALHTRLQTQQVTATLAYRLALPGTGHVEAQVYAQGVRQCFVDPFAEVSPYPERSDDRSWLGGARGYGTWRVAERWQLAAVVQGRHESLTPRDALASPPQGATSKRLWGSTGVQLDGAFRGVHVIPSVLVEGIIDRRAGRDPFGHFVAAAGTRALMPQGRLAMWQDRGAWSWRTNVARYGRLPAALELYGDAHGILGNAALTPEWGYNADIGVRLELPRAALPWRAELVIFASQSRDLITFEENAVGQARAVNLGRARIMGIDASTQWQFLPWLDVAAQATFMDPRNTSDTPQGHAALLLPNRARWNVLLQPRVHHGGLHAHIDTTYVAGAYLDPANLVLLPHRLIFGFVAGWRFNVGDVALRVQNLLDAHVFDIAGFPLPGRSVMLTLRLGATGES